MMKLFQTYKVPFFTLLGCLFMVTGLIWSRALLSIGMFVILIDIFFHRPKTRSKSIEIPILALGGIFLLYLLGGLNSSNWEEYVFQLKSKLPFILLPLAFLLVPGVPKRYYHGLLYAFLISISCATIYSLSLYVLDYEAITKSYMQAHVLPTFINHIRFSLMVAFGSLTAFYLYYKRYYYFKSWECYLQLTLGLLLMVFLHVLAVRSGLLAFYLCIGYGLLLLWKTQKKGVAILLLAMMVVAPIGAYWTVPSFKNKMGYVRYDVMRYFSNEDVSQLSDSRRIISWKVGVKAASETPLVGVGIGDIQSEMDAVYAKEYPSLAKENWLLPHNQFVYIYTGFGLLGLLLFTMIVFTPLIINWVYFHDPLYTAFNIIILSSFMSESTLETQIGTAFYLIFTLLGLSYFKSTIHSAVGEEVLIKEEDSKDSKRLLIEHK